MKRGHRMTDEEWRQHWKEYWDRARELAAGRWDSVLDALAPGLRVALSHKGKRHSPCPVHGGTDGFRFFRNLAVSGRAICNTCGHFHDGFAVLQWVNGWTPRESVEEVMKYLTGDASHDVTTPIRTLPPKAAPAPERDNEKTRVSLNRTLQRSIPMQAREAEPLRLYLARRGLTLPRSNGVRFVPSLAYSDGDKITGYHPAMLAVIQAPDGKPVTLHRTYLDSRGRKADVPEAKKLMAYPDDVVIQGSAIRLFPAGKVLGVAEGIETAFAAAEGMGIPTWATVNAILMERFVPPPEVEYLIVFVDKDRPSTNYPRGHGQEAARRLVKRMWERNVKCMAITPKGEIPAGEKSLDWLDVLNREGVKGFPSFEVVRQALLNQSFQKAA